MNGIFTASRASRSATLVCVKPCRIEQDEATWLAGAWWMRPISSASELLCTAVSRWPNSAASFAARSWTCSSVT